MKFTLSWLKDHLDTDANLETICNKLTSIGLEIEKIDDRVSLYSFTIVKILSVERVDDSDKLFILQIDAGREEAVQVVCGAPNVRVGLLGVWAPPSSCIPENNMKINVSKIRGIKSIGMMCSEKELMLSNNCDGIMELPDDAPIGGKLIDYLSLDDPIIDISLLPNRSDCTGVRGIAFDLAATGLGKLKDLNSPIVSTFGSIPLKIKLDLDDPNLCQGFAMCFIKGICNDVVSPIWMRRRLEAAGLRSINIVVDITNYISLDRGHPSHVFDASKLSGDITIRRARKGEKILTINDKEYDLSPDNVVIASDDYVESIAGIIGGKRTSCDHNTKDILLEFALWDTLNIARSGQLLGINTDSRYRFERGVDPQGMIPLIEHAVSLILSLCGGVASGIYIAKNEEYKPHKIVFVNSEVKRLSGVDVPVKDSLCILEKLGFSIEEEDGQFIVSVPSWRRDIEEKADLVEEILRIYGVDRIKSEPLYTSVEEKTSLPLQHTRISYAKRVLASRAMMEMITWSFISKKSSVLFGGGNPDLEILNSISTEMSDMRPSIFPGLFSVVRSNIDRSIPDLAIFEVSHIYENDTPEGQKCMAVGVRKGTACIEGIGRFWFEKSGKRSRNVDVFDAKADALAVIEPFVSIDSVHIEKVSPSWYHPGRSGMIKLGKTVLGYFGEFHPKILDFFGLSNPICGFEVYIDSIPISQKKHTNTKDMLHLPSLHPVKRDFSFIVDRSTPVSILVDVIKNVDCNVIVDVRVFDVFEGELLEKDKKSVAIEVLIQPLKKAFRDDDVQALMDRIIKNVSKRTNAVLRSS
ncbi:phenylalanine--tRNA ligase subunit beta [Candidatus Liberibacter brunswickensis]|uniref:phenylalanine--tRNA ligase subunit beta n=1 Tax=Candidatus Liberibacter brunswickensis TaxID=1968796 RepID=UPI002FE1122E